MNLIKTISFKTNNKSCGTCTKCCEGWLTATIDGYQMYPGQACYFLEQGVGCKRYETRPVYPCKKFVCTWLDMKDIPDKWKPENCGVIMKSGNIHDFVFIQFIEAPNSPSKEMILWAKEFFKKKKINFLYYDSTGVHPIGDRYFVRAIRDHKKQFEKIEFDDWVKEKYNLNK